MSLIQMNPGEMRTTFRELEQLRSQDQEIIRKMKTTVLGLDSVWKGEAQKALVERFQKGEATINSFHQALEQYIAIMEQAVTAAEAMDQNLGAMDF